MTYAPLLILQSRIGEYIHQNSTRNGFSVQKKHQNELLDLLLFILLKVSVAFLTSESTFDLEDELE